MRKRHKIKNGETEIITERSIFSQTGNIIEIKQIKTLNVNEKSL